MNAEERTYNAPDYALKIPALERLNESMPVRVGAMAPDFEASNLDGQRVRLRDLRGRHVVLMMGSITSPTCVFNIPAMNRLWTEFNPRGVDVYLVYAREAHPGERYPHHTSPEQKFAHARDLQRLENVEFPIIVDSLDGAIHGSYGLWPVALYVIHRDGRLVYQSNIAYPRDLGQFIEELIASDDLSAKPVRVPHFVYSERLVEREADQETHRRIYDRAGPKALEDYWKNNPSLRERWP
jgi:alkyl hydroperoxide reductase subunit AhpC